MQRILLSTVFALSILSASTAYADDDRCNVPMANWQPAESLQQKLEAEGWTVKRIKTEDGCYEVYAIDDKGERIEALFNPQTLDLISRKDHD